jgi:hypothetical protein
MSTRQPNHRPPGYHHRNRRCPTSARSWQTWGSCPCSCSRRCSCSCRCSSCHPERSEEPVLNGVEEPLSHPNPSRRFKLLNQPVAGLPMQALRWLAWPNSANPRAALFALFLFAFHSYAAAKTQAESQALWLSEQLHHPIEAAQILLAPDSPLEGCTITRARRSATGATALTLRCPTSRLPHLLLLTGAPHLPHLADAAPSSSPHQPMGCPHTPAVGACGAQPCVGAPHLPYLADAGLCSPIVHAGTTLTADWHTDFIHARLPVVALDSGSAGAEIRVRIPQTRRIVRARILGPHAVAILATGA